MAYIPTLKTKYKEEILPALMKEYGYKTVMQAPRLKKITLNQGLGKAAIADKKVIDKGIEEMTAITGQKAVATKSRKDISNFKLRRGMPIGVRVLSVLPSRLSSPRLISTRLTAFRVWI